MNQSPNEHPFARYIRILGKGKKGSRSLTEAEAYEAMTLLLAGEIEPEQLGAFLMLLRVKEETAEELCGFARAVRASIQAPELKELQVDLDWPSYAGKRGQAPWYLLAALALANSGVQVLMHGAGGHTSGRIYTENALVALGCSPVDHVGQLKTRINQFGFAFLPTRLFCPELDRVLGLKPLLGLRSPVNSLCRLINPADSKHCVQSVFHPSYAPIHQQAAIQLGTRHCVIAKGFGGEFELRPTADSRLHRVQQGRSLLSTIPRQFQRDSMIEKSADDSVLSDELIARQLQEVWETVSSCSDALHNSESYAEAAVLATLQACLLALEPDLSPAQANAQAANVWNRRDPAFLTSLRSKEE